MMPDLFGFFLISFSADANYKLYVYNFKIFF
jgi:hypothetical protein